MHLFKSAESQSIISENGDYGGGEKKNGSNVVTETK